MDSGTTRPMAVWAVDRETGVRGQYVVKYRNGERMSATSSAFELIAAWMALELNLPAAEPAIVNVSPAFVDSLKGREGYAAAAKSEGFNFATTYHPGYNPVPGRGFTLPNDQYEVMKMIYVFDLFVRNTDRGHQKTNLAFNGQRLLLYDHELAFSEMRVLSFLRSSTPWLFGENDGNLYQGHVFYPHFKLTATDFSEQVESLSCFNEDFWRKVYSLVPEDWQSEEVKNIAPHILSIVENKHYFAESLNKTAST